MRPAAVSGARRKASNALLLAGYPAAVVAGAKLVPVLRQRRTRRFLVLEAGTLSVVTGLVLRRRLLPAALNAGAAVALAGAWVATSRRR
jgi:hypothetical protein